MNMSRQPKGIPTGGQFAASSRGEADVPLHDGPRLSPNVRQAAQQWDDYEAASSAVPQASPVRSERSRRIEQASLAWDAYEAATIGRPEPKPTMMSRLRGMFSRR